MEISEQMKERLAKAFDYIESHKEDSRESLHAQFFALQQQFLEVISNLSDAQFTYKLNDKEWSIKEVCLHVSNSMRGGGSVVPILAGGTTLTNDVQPGVLDADPGDQAAILRLVEKEFEGVLKNLACLDGTENREATFKHPFFGPLECRQTAAFNNLHLNIHLKQVQRVKGYENFPK